MKSREDYIDEMIMLGYSNAEILERLSEPEFYLQMCKDNISDTKEEIKKKVSDKKRRFRFGKKFLAAFLAGFIAAGGIGGFCLHRKHEVVKIKNYLEDFLTEDHYVDISKIGTDYDIKTFDGQYLYEALKGSNINYVRVAGDYITNNGYEGPFKQMTGMNKDVLLGYDDFGEPVYEGYDPIKRIVDGKLVYDLPDEYTLEEVAITPEAVDAESIVNSAIVVRRNDYEESYTLSLEKKQ